MLAHALDLLGQEFDQSLCLEQDNEAVPLKSIRLVDLPPPGAFDLVIGALVEILRSGRFALPALPRVPLASRLLRELEALAFGRNWRESASQTCSWRAWSPLTVKAISCSSVISSSA